MINTYEIQFDTPAGRSAFMLVAAPNANEARLLARDMLLEFVAHDADRAAIRAAMKDATIYEVVAQRISAEDDGADEVDRLIAEGERAVDEAFYHDR